MSRTRIKICGVTNEEDADNLVDFGIDALGFIVTDKDIPSKIDIYSAASIITKLPKKVISVLGVGKCTAEEVIGLYQLAKPNVVQLQRDMSISAIKKIQKKCGQVKIWKAFFTDDEPDLHQIRRYEESVDAILIHSKENQWQRGLKIARALDKPFVLAGGLNKKNIRKAISLFNPYMIDLIRGVESLPGKKDFRKVREVVKIITS